MTHLDNFGFSLGLWGFYVEWGEGDENESIVWQCHYPVFPFEFRIGWRLFVGFIFIVIRLYHYQKMNDLHCLL